MNKRRRHAAKARRRSEFYWWQFAFAATYLERRRALLWLRAREGFVWP